MSTKTWGTGKAKTIHHLLSEIQEGETVLEETEKGLVRKTSFLTIHVLYKDERGTFKLFEEKQVFTDGRTRTRDQSWSVAEKMKATDVNIQAAALRALEEELGIMTGVKFLGEITTTDELRESPSYPGLTAQFKMFNLTVHIDYHEYRPDGYTEVQEDKSTYFKWKHVEP
ncbi:MAG TPA: hypothetical protein VJH55_01580 [Candidatus Paceibacterota bacterium]